MENISRGPTYGDFVNILTEGLMQDNMVTRLRSTRVQTPLSPSFKCNVLRESLSVDRQSKYSLRNTKEKGVVCNLCISLVNPKKAGEQLRGAFSVKSHTNILYTHKKTFNKFTAHI